ncbi:serine-rich adhesin for platelets-like isoform X2 [Mytilus trossulus]|uniref:serine-rich adhesin for platelets-like isoform X2 n=1 Tax=Mytilus trossulus TaxID=6551 RepID=UPI003006DCC1
MACYGLCKDRYVLQTKVLLPHPWESLADLCQDLYEATVIQGNKRLVVCVACSGQNYKVDLTSAKSATVICAVGITFGLGGFILYRLYCKFIQPLFKKSPKKKKSQKRNGSQEIDGTKCETSMGNSNSNKAVTSAYFSPTTGVALHVGRKSRSRDNLKTQTESSHVRQRKKVKRRKTSSDKDLTRSLPIKVPSSQSEISINQLVHSASDVSNLDLEGSLKANVSLQSLTDRNMIESLRHANHAAQLSDDLINHLPDLTGAPYKNSEDSIQVEHLSNKESCDNQTASSNTKYHIELSDDLLTVSSVLLTPPSEDDGQDRFQGSHLNPHHNKTNTLQHPLSSYSSDYNTDSKKSGTDDCHVSTADESESGSCDEKDSVSSLPKLRSPDRFFRESLLYRLQECHNGAGSSNSSSLDSSPEFSPYARYRKYSIESESLSGLATPDNEMFTSIYEVGRSTEDQFYHLEEEVGDIEEEFASLTNKLNELKNIALQSDSSSIDYSPSHPLAKKAVEMVDKTRNRLSRSRSVSVSSTDSSPACNGSLDVPDLSWDSEGLHGDNSNKNTPSSRRCSEPGNSLRNKFHSKLFSKDTNNGISFESPMESDIEKDGTLDNISTDECFEINLSDWPKDDSSDSPSHSKINFSSSAKDSSQMDGETATSSSSAKESSQLNSKSSIKMSSEASSSSCYESARDTSQSQKSNGIKEENDCDSKQEANNNGIVQICDRVHITKYVDREWKGQTDRANTIRKAYLEIPKVTGCQHLCRVRGDNYCGLRGTLFQCLCHGIDISKHWSDINNITDKLTRRYKERSSGLNQWTFAGRLSCQEGQRLSMMSHCLSLLFSKFEEAKSFESQSDRELWTINLLNSDPTCDLHLMEGLKLLMLLNMLDLKDKQDRDEDIPIFVWLLFARDTSESPFMFVKNHLNNLGNNAGIEQIEMFLLGHTLSVRIQVLRLSQFGQEDFIAYYPDDADSNWSQISLIAEDDRHYNVPVP